MTAKNDKLRSACEAAFLTLKKINDSEYAELQSKLEYCIGSYDHDKNPIGLIEFGQKALNALNEIKKKNARKVKKEIITSLETSLK